MLHSVGVEPSSVVSARQRTYALRYNVKSDAEVSAAIYEIIENLTSKINEGWLIRAIATDSFLLFPPDRAEVNVPA